LAKSITLIMTYFPELRTSRRTIQLKELTIGGAIKLARSPANLQEKNVTEFINQVVEMTDNAIVNSEAWTVQERTLAVAHYLASVLDDAPDFELGDGHYSDFFDGSMDETKEEVELGEFSGDKWKMRHLRGYMSESIERINGEVDGVDGRYHWILGALATQLFKDDDMEIPDYQDKDAYDKWLIVRMTIFNSYPESDFEKIVLAFYDKKEELNHFFKIDFDETGIVNLPIKEVDSKLLPARFPVNSCLSSFAIGMAE